MNRPAVTGAANILIHAPHLLLHGAMPRRWMKKDPLYKNLLHEQTRSYLQAVHYPPNQAFIGNLLPQELPHIKQPWWEKVKGGSSQGKFGEIISELTLYRMLAATDHYDLIYLNEQFLENQPTEWEKQTYSWSFSQTFHPQTAKPEKLQEMLEKKHAIALEYGEEIAGVVLPADQHDETLQAHMILENAVNKVTAALAVHYLLQTGSLKRDEVKCILECSEESVGDSCQRGGGGLAKAIGEIAGCLKATGSDVRSFCAGPMRAFVHAASFIQAGMYPNVVVTGGGSLAKLGMNAKSHVDKQLPVLEDCLAATAFSLGSGDSDDPVVRTDAIGQLLIGDSVSPATLATRLLEEPLKKIGLNLTEVDEYASELQNPEITMPTGAGDVPLQNYLLIGALAVQKEEITLEQLPAFIEQHGVPGFAPTQGHIPAGVAYLGHARGRIKQHQAKRIMIAGRGSLFLGRMTKQMDAVSILLESPTNNAQGKERE